MNYKCLYKTPEDLDDMLMISDGEFLTGLYFLSSIDKEKSLSNTNDLPIFEETKKWLDIYFNGHEPCFIPSYKINNLTPFRQRVMEIMLTIPFGKTMTYNEIANIIAKEKKITKMSAQAVGNAVGWNPICLIIPCHRVIGSNNNLTGYGGGINNKIALLARENNDMSKLCLPKKKLSQQKQPVL